MSLTAGPVMPPISEQGREKRRRSPALIDREGEGGVGLGVEVEGEEEEEGEALLGLVDLEVVDADIFQMRLLFIYKYY